MNRQYLGPYINFQGRALPPAEQPWGADVGWLTDKFGISWLVSIDKA
jgi:uncharacterized glyoxalase superfamily protein PhnB